MCLEWICSQEDHFQKRESIALEDLEIDSLLDCLRARGKGFAHMGPLEDHSFRTDDTSRYAYAIGNGALWIKPQELEIIIIFIFKIGFYK